MRNVIRAIAIVTKVIANRQAIQAVAGKGTLRVQDTPTLHAHLPAGSTGEHLERFSSMSTLGGMSTRDRSCPAPWAYSPSRRLWRSGELTVLS